MKVFSQEAKEIMMGSLFENGRLEETVYQENLETVFIAGV